MSPTGRRIITTVGFASLMAVATTAVVWAWWVEDGALRALVLRGEGALWSTYTWNNDGPRLALWQRTARLSLGAYGLDPWLTAAVTGAVVLLGAWGAGLRRGRGVGLVAVWAAPVLGWLPALLAWSAKPATHGARVWGVFREAALSGTLPEPVGLGFARFVGTRGGVEWPWQVRVAELPQGALVQDAGVVVLGLLALGTLGVAWLRVAPRPAGGRGLGWAVALGVAAAVPAAVVAQSEEAHQLRRAEQAARGFQADAVQAGVVAAWGRVPGRFGSRWRALLSYDGAKLSEPLRRSHRAGEAYSHRHADPMGGAGISCPEETPSGADLRASGTGPDGVRFRLVLLDASRPGVVALPLGGLAAGALLLWVALGRRRRWLRGGLVWLGLSLPTVSAASDLRGRVTALAAAEPLSALREPVCRVPLALGPSGLSRLGLTAGWVVLLGGMARCCSGQAMSTTRPNVDVLSKGS